MAERPIPSYEVSKRNALALIICIVVIGLVAATLAQHRNFALVGAPGVGGGGNPSVKVVCSTPANTCTATSTGNGTGKTEADADAQAISNCESTGNVRSAIQTCQGKLARLCVNPCSPEYSLNGPPSDYKCRVTNFGKIGPTGSGGIGVIPIGGPYGKNPPSGFAPAPTADKPYWAIASSNGGDTFGVTCVKWVSVEARTNPASSVVSTSSTSGSEAIAPTNS